MFWIISWKKFEYWIKFKVPISLVAILFLQVKASVTVRKKVYIYICIAKLLNAMHKIAIKSLSFDNAQIVNNVTEGEFRV